VIRLEVTLDRDVSERTFAGDTVTIGRADDSDVVLDDVEGASFVDIEVRVLGGRCVVAPRGFGAQAADGSATTAFLDAGDEFLVGPARLRLLEFGPDASEPERVRPCLVCGELLRFSATACPSCAAAVPTDRRSKIHRWRIKGYELRRRIGGGGMGIVFEALRYSDAKPTAVKIMRPDLAGDASYLVRFVEEMRALTQLRHPNIVEIYDRGTQGDLAWIEMELVRGDSVRGLMRREGPIAEKEALRVLWHVALALDFAASKRIVHGDVKPSNFLIDERGWTKLCDFGLAVLRRGPRPMGMPGREVSSRKGTAAYAAPELFDARHPPTVSSDIYSLGASLFVMLTGQLPFGAQGQTGGRRKATRLPDARVLVPTLRPATCMLMERMADPDPAQRYKSYRELQDDLGLLMEE
jgi:serine/threonine protein kinase